MSLIDAQIKLALSRSRLEAARAMVHTAPTEAQIQAGNYAKGHVHWKGLRVSIENPRGATRSGTASDGAKWSVVMKHDYGYFKGIKGKDKEHLDVFIGPHLNSELVHVVNQRNTDGTFDEHKVVLGAQSKEQAKRVYLANYSDGWNGCHSVIPMTLAQFKKWTDKGKVTAMAEEVVKTAELSYDDFPWPNKDQDPGETPVCLGDHMRKLKASDPERYKARRHVLDDMFSRDKIGEETSIKAPSPHVRQTEDNCGPAAVEIATDKELPQAEVAEEAGMTHEHGTPPEGLVEAAREADPGAHLHENMSVEQLVKYLDEKRPVICDIQAWGEKDDYDELQDGHYVVAVGHDSDTIYFVDPSSEENHTYLSKDELADRWRDKEDGDDGKVWNRTGIVLSPKQKPSQPLDEEPEKMGSLFLGDGDGRAIHQDVPPLHESVHANGPAAASATETLPVSRSPNGPALGISQSGVGVGGEPDSQASIGGKPSAAASGIQPDAMRVQEKIAISQGLQMLFAMMDRV
jgi:hypothetical protein